MTQSGRWLLCLLIGAGLPASSAKGQEPTSEAVQKGAVAESIIAREEAASDRQFDSVFRAKAKELLATLPLGELASQTGEVGLGLNSLGDSQADLVYTPVTPCRIIDTRLVGGKLAPGVPRSIRVTEDTTSQGGANCGIPFGPATSAMINFVAISPAGRGNMQITPFGQAMPLASFLNYSNTAGTNLANGLAVALCNPSAATCTNDVTIQANNSAVDLVADVQGYFQRVSTAGVGTALLADAAVTAPKISSGVVVRSLNSLTDAVTLAAGSNVSITPSGSTLTVSAAPGPSGGDITAVIAGTGLAGGGETADLTLSVQFAGTGTADTAARSDHTHPPRSFYVTPGLFTANQVLTACAAGYHLASYWEIHEPSNFAYDTSLGLRRASYQSGPPIVAGICGGYDPVEAWLDNGTAPGWQNCNGWTDSGGSIGLTAYLCGEGYHQLQADCGEQHHVWCVSDRIYIP